MLPPQSLPGLVAYYRADRGLWKDAAGTIPAFADGDPVRRWDDLSGSGFHLINDGTITLPSAQTPPTLKVNVQNGQQIVRFNGSKDLLRCSVATPTIGTMFLVAYNSQATFTATHYEGSFTDVSVDSVDTNITFVGNGGGGAGVGWYLAAGRWSWANSVWMDGAANTGASNIMQAWHTHVGMPTTPSAAVVGLQIGGDRASTSAAQGPKDERHWKGDVGECGIYSGRLSTVDRQTLEAYERVYWGTP